jgi:NADH-ubiquinone oxidoreductase chain 5
MRSSPLIEYSSTVLMLCLGLGAITTVFSSLIGLFQQDIKKVIAYSTMSQLGMMVIAVGLSCYNIALFHLVNHAFYKALLFLGAGAVIHAVADNQDFRKYGGLRPFLPLTYSVMLIASLSLVAFPFMTGFYSKDFILESAYGQYYFSSTVVYIIATIGAMFTTLYSVKVLYLTFLTNPNGPLINYKRAHEGDIFMSLPLMILAVFSIFFGFITKDMFIGLGSGFFSDNALFIHPSHEIMLDTEFGVPTLFKLLPLLFTISLSVIAIVLSEYLSTFLVYFKLSRVGYNIFSFFNQRFLIELFYNRFITGVVLKLGGQTTKVLDKGSVEYIGPYGLEKGLLNISNNIAKLNTGVITTYALYILVGVIFYMLFSLYLNNIIIILSILVSFSVLHGSYYNTDTSIDRYGIGGVILTSNFFLDVFPVFSLFFSNPELYHHILANVEPAIMDDVCSVCRDLEGIAKRLISTNDPLVAEVRARFIERMNIALEAMAREPGPYTYGYKSAYIHLSLIRVECLENMSSLMTRQELQMIGVARETLTNTTNEFVCLHSQTLPAFVEAGDVRGGNLLVEINKLMSNNPFNR